MQGQLEDSTLSTLRGGEDTGRHENAKTPHIKHCILALTPGRRRIRFEFEAAFGRLFFCRLSGGLL